MDWSKEAAHWPHAESSEFILCKPHHWHIQQMGEGPLLLLVHGAGGGTQSWRHLMPLLARSYRVVTVDLPGQGFTRNGAQRRLGLEPMAQDLRTLCADQGWSAKVIIGHSAGAAIALQMAQKMEPPPPVIGINAALGNFKGLAGVLFPLIAKGLAMTPWVAQLFTVSTANPRSVERLIAGTGSKLSLEEMRWYRALVGDPGHVRGTLGMMAQWDLGPLLRALPQHPAPVLLVTGENDLTVPPSTSRNVARGMVNAEVLSLPGLGHLAHEEDAPAVHAAIMPFLADQQARH